MKTLRTLVLVLFAAALGWAWSSVPSTSLVRGPYLQSLGTSSTTLVFRTADPVAAMVRYGTRQGPPWEVELTSATGTTHVFELDTLEPRTRYYYEIVANGSVLATGEEFSFRTAPAANSREPFRFVAWGDSGTGGSGQMRVAQQIDALEPSGELALGLGDLVYSSGEWENYDPNLFQPYENIFPRMCFWPTMGNHDYKTQNGAPYFDAFYLPTESGAPGKPSNTELYYSFDYGMAHFVCLDSESSDVTAAGAMYKWVEADLDDARARGKRWLIVFMHHPPHSAGTHESLSESKLENLSKDLVPLLESKGVDMVLAGHSHNYERSFLAKGMTVMQSDPDTYSKIGSPDGTIFLVSGCAGKSGSGPLDHPLMAYSEGDIYGFSVLDVSHEALRGYFVYDDGTATDLFEVKKDADARSPHVLDARVTRTGPAGQVVLVFDEPLVAGTGAAGAENTGNYLVQQAVSVTGATLLSDQRTVVLDTSALSAGTAYSLAVTQVQDVYGNAIDELVWFGADGAMAPVVRIDADPLSANVPALVTLSGARSYDLDGTLVDYLWDPGDGSALAGGASIQHSYARAGTFWATLIVTDDDGKASVGRREIRLVSEGNGPIASFAMTTSDPAAGAAAEFDASQSRDPDGGGVLLHWDFGDPSSGASNQSAEVRPAHVYADEGDYVVTLTVTDDEGATASGTLAVTVGPISGGGGGGGGGPIGGGDTSGGGCGSTHVQGWGGDPSFTLALLVVALGLGMASRRARRELARTA